MKSLSVCLGILFLLSRLIILIFLPILGLKYFCEYSQITAYNISVFPGMYWCLDGINFGTRLQAFKPDMIRAARGASTVFVDFQLVLPFREKVNFNGLVENT